VHDIRFEDGFIGFSAHSPIESWFFKNGKGLPDLFGQPLSK
jgi:hypothetical protein